MPRDVEARIRALPGNDKCVDCNNVAPQWASISYGALVCLECSGQHRSLGVHLSFVRSVVMDSWTQKQIAAMERSGGNANLVEFFAARGINKSMKIATKYNTKQAAYYKDRLSQDLDGKVSSLLDPGSYEQAAVDNRAVAAGNTNIRAPANSKLPKSQDFAFDDDWGHEKLQVPRGAGKSTMTVSTPSAKHMTPPEPIKTSVAKSKDNHPTLLASSATAAKSKAATKPGLGEPDDFFAQFGC